MESAYIDFTFFSASPISVAGPSWTAFNVNLTDGTYVGIGNTTNMVVKQGYNDNKRVHLLLYGMETGGAAKILEMVAQYAAGESPHLIMSGPVSSAAPIMNNILHQEVTMVGRRYTKAECANETDY